MPPKKTQDADFSDSTRQQLQQLLEEHQIERAVEKLLAERSAKRSATFKAVVSWVGAAALLIGASKDALAWAAVHLKAWLGIP